MSKEKKQLQSEDEVYQRYITLKKILSESQDAVNGELVPKNKNEFESLKKDIAEIEETFPHFSFFRSSEKDSSES